MIGLAGLTQLAALPYQHLLTLPTLPPAVRLARETAELALAEWGISSLTRHPVTDPALLILSELVTNSVRHAAARSPQVTIMYAASRDTFAFGVHDRHPYQPPLYGAMTGGGSGLATVVHLTLELAGTAGVHRDADGGGKSIWVTLPL
ncbi:ATP-binding protein [Streptomyces sp. NPDC057702]|uniref:ATP-binding protein n=1 Tax=unclassified Streptomyces TaxID=2593676 RepID=UPI0036B8A38D